MATCQRCQAEISADAIACPDCDWEPRKRGHLTAATLIGAVLTLTGVGAIVGVPMIVVSGYLDHARRDDRPADVAPA